MPASWPAAVGSTGAPPSSRGEPVAQRCVEELDLRRPGLLDGVGRRRRPPTAATTDRTARPRPRRARPARPAPATGTALVPLGCTSTRPTVATAPRSAAASRAREHGRGEPEHRVVAVGQPGGAGVVGLAGQVEAPPAVRPDAVGDADRGGPVDQGDGPARRAARRSVPTRRSVSSSRPRCAGSWPAARIASASVVPSRSAQAAGLVGVQRAGQQPRAGAGDAEPGALLVGEADDRRAAGPGRGRGRAAGRPRRRRRPRRAARRRRRRRAPSRGGCR